jgi:hypothetical protein
MDNSEPESSGQTAEDLTAEEILDAALIGQTEETGDSESETEAPEPEDEVEETTETEEEEEAVEEPESTGPDFANLTDEEIQTLLDNPNARSGLLKRISKLTARAKEAEERISKIQQTTPKAPSKNIEIPAAIAEIETLEELEVKREELDEVYESCERLLQTHRQLADDDVVNVKGQDFTIRQIIDAKFNARRGIDKILPAQEAAIRDKQEVGAMAENVQKIVEERFGEMMGDEAFSERYQGVMNDPEIKKAMEASPRLGAQLPFIAAHYLRSLVLDEQKPAKKPETPTKGAAPKIKPPNSPGGVGSPTRKPADARKKITAARQEFEQSGSEDALERLLASQLTD